MKNWFNTELYTLKECEQMDEWVNKVFNEEILLDDIPKKYREAVNSVLNSN